MLKATPVITWVNPPAIRYGTPLGAAQLNATANVLGTFSYSPPAGTILNAGTNQTLTATFTPTDSANYSTATATVSLNVLEAPLVITNLAVSRGADSFSFAWNVATNKTYRVQYKNSLSDADWIDLPTAPIVTGLTASITDVLGANLQRYYRILETN